MKKRILSVALALALILVMTATSLAVDTSQEYAFVLTEETQGPNVSVSAGEEFVIEFRLIRTDIGEDETYELYVMQNEVYYDTDYLELADAELVEDFGGNTITYRDTSIESVKRIQINSGLNGRGEYDAHMLVARMTFRAVGEGITDITNNEVIMSTADAGDVFATTVTDVKVTIGEGGATEPPEGATYSITLTQPAGGTIAASPAERAQAGSTVALGITLGNGYSLSRWHVTGADGAAIDVSGLALVSGASFVMPNQAATVTAALNYSGGNSGQTGGGSAIIIDDDTPLLAAPDVPRFDDVPETHWAYTYVEYMAEIGFVNGKTGNLFYPGDSITRGEFVTILARMSGETLTEYGGDFTDVGASQYYAKAVEWALRAGVTLGTSETTFSPDVEISRQDIAVMIMRYITYKGFELDRKNALTEFSDAAQIAEYANDAVTAMQRANVISGYEDGSFRPTGSATRAESAKMLALVHNGMYPDLIDG